MSAVSPTATLPGASWRGDLLGALNATAAMLPFVVSYGFIAYGALGASAAQAGLTASVIAVVLGGAVMAALGGSRLPSASPSASSCLIVAAAVLGLLRDPALPVHSPAGSALLLACVALVVVAGGLLTMLLGTLKAGSLVRFVPQPVLAGLMNGVAILLVLSQLEPMLGLAPGSLTRDGLRAVMAWQPAALAIALATVAAVVLAAWRWPRAPAPLVALVVAGLAVWLWQSNAAPGSAAAALQRIGELDVELPRPDALMPLADTRTWALLARHFPALAFNALLIAVIGALESVMNLSAVQQRLDDRSDPNRELLAVGAANVVSGLFGGLPVVYMRLRVIATLNGGGRRRAAMWLGCLLLALTFTIGLPLVEPLSTAVIAGVVVALAWTLVDRWTRQLVAHWWRGDHSADLRRSLIIVVVVSVVMVVWGIGAGAVIGVLLAAVSFIRTLNRQVVRNRYSAADFPSRRVYETRDEAALAPLRSRIRVLELEGALFFGNADRLAQEAEGLASDTLDLVVDLRRISTIDASGAVALAQLGQRLGGRGIRLRLAGVRPSERHARALLAHGIAFAAPDDRSVQSSGLRVYQDLDRATEAAELHVLAAAAPEHLPRAVALADCRVLAGLDSMQLATLSRHLRERRLAAGVRLFGEGEPGLSLYVLTEGSISVVDPRRGQRFATLSPGMCFGETALLDGGGRSADAVADVASVVHELTKDALGPLQRDEPELAAQLYWNLAQHLSERLRAASSAWRREAN